MKVLVNWIQVCCLVLLTACSTTHYKESADKEVYTIVEEKSPAVPGMSQDFTIESEEEIALDGLPEVEEEPIAEVDGADGRYLGDVGPQEVGAKILSLEKALELAVEHNRNYQTQKELVYLAALDLTLQRDRFQPRFFGAGGGSYNRSTRDVVKTNATTAAAQSAPEFVRAVGDLTGTSAELVGRYAQVVESAAQASGLNQPRQEIMDERSVSADTSFGFDVLRKGGAAIAMDLTSNFFEFLTGDPRTATSSILSATITRPLLRGAGKDIAAENLTQAERNALYEIRDFTRFRKEFSVQIASQYYRVLQNRDIVRNNYLGFIALQKSAERDAALVEEGRKTEADLGRSEQAAFNAEDNWIQAINNYTDSLDSFKIQLGLPTAADVVLDDEVFAKIGEPVDDHVLRDLGIVQIQHPDIGSEEAVEVAMASRLDLQNIRDTVDDAERQVKVAANNLLADLDVSLAANVESPPDLADRFQELDFRRGAWSAGLDVNLPIERTAERNSYRTALISLERAERNRNLSEDNVTLDVRNAWRNLDEARRTYEIQTNSVLLSLRRVELENLKAELGRGTTLDLVDAQNDLIQSRNALTSALVSHTIARLTFWQDMGILYIKENGQWEDLTNDSTNEST